MHGAGEFDEGIDGHLGGAYLQLAVVAGADVSQFGHLLPGQPQFLPPLPQALSDFHPLLFLHYAVSPLFCYCKGVQLVIKCVIK